MVGRLALFAIVSFVFHFIWESAHIHLYTTYETLGSGTSLLLLATAGDVLYALLGVACVAIVFRDCKWLEHPNTRHVLAAMAYGFIIAVLIEWKALILHKWAYTTAMPIVPVVRVGLSPVLQMVVLVPLAVWVTFYCYKSLDRNNSL